MRFSPLSSRVPAEKNHPKNMNAKYVLSQIGLFLSYPFRSDYTANVCGHKTKRSGEILHATGDHSIMTMPLAENGRSDYCLDCIGKMAIPCGWCGKSIHVGDPITLYVAGKDAKLFPGAKAYLGTVGDPAVNVETLAAKPWLAGSSAEQVTVVGCLRWECADTGCDRAGFWIPPGTVDRVQTPIEMLLASGRPEAAVIVSDLGDRRNIGTIVEI